jgi:hypothetical protein
VKLIQSEIACHRTKRIDAFAAGFFILENVRRTGSPVLHDKQCRPPYMSGSVELIIQTIHQLPAGHSCNFGVGLYRLHERFSLFPANWRLGRYFFLTLLVHLHHLTSVKPHIINLT